MGIFRDLLDLYYPRKKFIISNVKEGFILLAKNKALKDSNNWRPIYKDIANIIGEENTIKLYKHFRGLTLNFPMKLLSKEGMTNIVKSEYDGHNVVYLAREYGYSMRHINRIIKDNNL